MSDTDLALLVGALQQQVQQLSTAQMALATRVGVIESRPTLSAPTATWCEDRAAAASLATTSAANRKAFLTAERRQIVGTLLVMPFTTTAGFALGQILPHVIR